MARRGPDRASFARELEPALRGRTREDRKMLFVGVLNRHMPEGREAVLVGGALVEFYTSGAYVTGDLDIIGDRDAIVPLLESAGFFKSGRTWWNTDLELVVDIAGRDLRRTETVVAVEFEGFTVPTVSLEDLIVDRLLAAKYWKSPTDWEQAVLLLTAHESRVSVGALKQKAAANDVGDSLRELTKVVGSDGPGTSPTG